MGAPAVSERFLVTGAAGCIGAWTVAQLHERGASVVALDVAPRLDRLALVGGASIAGAVPFIRADITELPALARALDEHEITNVIHLAALQVPFCRADPPRGALVNVVGTVNVLEAVKGRGEGMAPVVYASSIAAFDAEDGGGMHGVPGTIYGVYKRANEGSARRYFEDEGVSSVGLRPHTVYGVGRDQGLTSAPTLAMLAAAAGRPYRIPYGGASQLQYAPDVASVFIAASRSGERGASVHNLPGRAVEMPELIAAIEAAAPDAEGTIDYVDAPLPFPAEADSSSLRALLESAPQTPLAEAVAETVARFRELLSSGAISSETLERPG
jgi:UDP-glucuronate 4-epimerase